FSTSAGARLTVMWRDGNDRPSAANAERTRSRDSATVLSGNPTTANAGRPGVIVTWASTSTTSTPLNASVRTRATMPGPAPCLAYWGPYPPLARKLTDVCGYAPAARATPTSSVFRRVVGAGQEVAATGLVGPVFPGPPGLGRIGAVAAVAGGDFAVGQVFDLATELFRTHQGAGVARQIDRHAH